jgi:hypothetical protein
MAGTFDPYHTWLGIPPEERPAHHYRLLGLKAFEGNLDVIEHAADQKMMHLRTFQSGKHEQEAQSLLNEIARAKVTLLDPDKKGEYDTQLRSKLAATKAAEHKRLPKAVPLAVALPLDTKPPTPPPSIPTPTVVSASPSSSRQKPNSKVILLALAGGGVALLLVVVLIIALQGRDEIAARPGTADSVPATNATAPKPQVVAPPVTVPIKPPVAPINPKPTVEEPPPTPEPVPPQPEVEKPNTPPSDPPADVEPASNDPPVPATETEDPDAAPVEAKKLPVPERAERDARRAEILQVFPPSQARTLEEKGKLIEQLMTTATETKDDPAARFALLNIAREQGVEAGQIRLALEAIDELEQTFEFDADAVRVSSLLQALKATTTPVSSKQEVVAAGIELAETLAAAEKFDETDTLCDRVLVAARGLRDAALVQSLTDRRKSIDELAASFKKAQAALDTLKKEPSNADAALAAGQYLAFVKQDWEAGLQHLAKGSDTQLAAAAQAELAVPELLADQEKMADAWWTAADAQKNPAMKDQCRHRAEFWYRQIVDDLKGLAKVKAEKRIVDAEKIVSTQVRTGPKPKRQIIRIPISANIEGGDLLKVYATRAEWQHVASEWARDVSFNGKAWPVQQQAILAFEEEAVHKIGELDFQKSAITKVRGRGDVTLVRKEDHVEIHFGDGGSGSDQYDVLLEVYATGKPTGAARTVAGATGKGRDWEVVFLDDVKESSFKSGDGGLGKHGDSHQMRKSTSFLGQIPEHTLGLSGVASGSAYVIYDLDGTYENFSAVAALMKWVDGRGGDTTGSPITFRVIGDEKVLWVSAPMQRKDTGQEALVNIRNVRKLVLEMNCAGSGEQAVGAWINPKIARRKSAVKETTAPAVTNEVKAPKFAASEVKDERDLVLYVDDLPFAAADAAYARGTPGRHGMRNFTFDGGGDSQDTFKGQPIAHGLSTHAYDNNRPSFVEVEVPAKATSFRAVGTSLGQPFSPLTFRVFGDGKELWKSDPVTAEEQEVKCDIPLKGIRQLRLEVVASERGRGGLAFWIDPRFVRAATGK